MYLNAFGCHLFCDLFLQDLGVLTSLVPLVPFAPRIHYRLVAITKHSVPIRFMVSSIIKVSMDTATLRKGVFVDDWTAESVIIASNDKFQPLCKMKHSHYYCDNSTQFKALKPWSLGQGYQWPHKKE